MKRLFTLCFVLLALVLVKDTYAQQDAEYTQYMFNGLVLNPAYAGSRGGLSATAIYRNQWVNIPEAPRTFSIAGHTPIGDSNSAVGLWLESDQLGVHDKIRLYASYAYHIPMGSNDAKLSLGVQGGLLNINSNFTEASVITANDPAYAENISNTLPNFGLGAYYYAERFFAGVALPHLLNNQLYEDLPNVTVEGARQYRHLFATAGVVLPFGEKLDFRPTALLKAVPGAHAPVELDLTAHFLINKVLWLGAAWRSGDSIDFLAELNFGRGFRAGYSYDLTTTKLGDYNDGSHEFMLGYDVQKDKSRVLTPRYF